MLAVSASVLDAAKFEFSFTTSDGDKINLKMSDVLKSDGALRRGHGFKSVEYTLSHEYSYEFSYKGNGLSKQDLKEIKEALKKVKPMLEKFLKAKEAHQKEISNFANSLKSLLPKPKNNNHELAIKHHTLNTFDEILKEVNKKSALESAKKLFDRLFSEKFEIFV